MTYNADGNIHPINDEWAYSLKYIDHDDKTTIENIFEKHKHEFIKKYIEYMMLTNNLSFIYRPPFSIERGSFAMKFKRANDDEIFFKEVDEKT